MASHRGRKVPANAEALGMLESWTKDDRAMQQMIAEERGNAAIARQIYALRKSRGLTQRQLAELVGTRQPVIARLEDADYDGHSLAMLSRIGEALGYSVAVAFVPLSSASAVQHIARAPRRRPAARAKAKASGAARKRSVA